MNSTAKNWAAGLMLFGAATAAVLDRAGVSQAAPETLPKVPSAIDCAAPACPTGTCPLVAPDVDDATPPEPQRTPEPAPPTPVCPDGQCPYVPTQPPRPMPVIETSQPVVYRQVRRPRVRGLFQRLFSRIRARRAARGGIFLPGCRSCR